jgi:cell division protein FtsA
MLANQGYKSKRQRTVAVLDVGTSKICCLIAKPMGGSDWQSDAHAPQFQVIGLGHQQAVGMKGGSVVNMDLAEKSIAAAIDQAERMAGVTVGEVVLTVSCGRIRSENFQASVDVASNAVRDQDINRVLAAGRDYAMRDGAIVLHTIPTAYRLDGGTPIADPRGMIADRFQADIHSIAVDEKPLRNLMLSVERCHVSIAGMVAAPYASALATLSPDEANLGVTCIDFGAGTTTLAVFTEGQFVYADALAIGGNLLTMDLARSLASPLSEAERMKILHASAFVTSADEREGISFPMVGEAHEAPQFNRVTKAQITEFVSPRVEEILEHIRHRIEANGLDAIAGHPVVLTGGASQLPGLAELTSRILGSDVRHGIPRGAAGLPNGCMNPVFATAVGALSYSNLAQSERPNQIHPTAIAADAGYLSRVGQWIRESF